MVSIVCRPWCRRRTASIAPAMPPAVIWVPNPTDFLSPDALDMMGKRQKTIDRVKSLHPSTVLFQAGR